MTGLWLLLLGFFQICAPFPSPSNQQQSLLILSELCYLHNETLDLYPEKVQQIDFIKIMPPKDFCDDPKRILQLITSHHSKEPILGSLEAQLCSPAHVLAEYLNVTLTTWNCPQEEIDEESVASANSKNMGPSIPLVARGFAEMVHFMKWKSVAIISTKMGWWPKLSQALALQLRELGIIPKLYIMIPQNSSQEQIEYKLRGLKKTHCRAVIVCASGNAFGRAVLETLDVMGLAKDQNTLTVLMDISTLPSWTSVFKETQMMNEFIEKKRTEFLSLLTKYNRHEYKNNNNVYYKSNNDNNKRRNYSDFLNNNLLINHTSQSYRIKRQSSDNNYYSDETFLDRISLITKKYVLIFTETNILNLTFTQKVRYYLESENVKTDFFALKHYDTLKIDDLKKDAQLKIDDSHTEHALPTVSSKEERIPLNPSVIKTDVLNSFTSTLSPQTLKSVTSSITSHNTFSLRGLKSVTPLSTESTTLSKKTDVFSLLDLREDDSMRTLLTLTYSHATGEFEVNEDQGSLEEWSVKHLDQDDCETCESELTKILNIVLILVCSCLSVFMLFGVAAVARYHLLKKRVNKGPYKVLLTATDFVFPQIGEGRRVNEGIEAMLCCWLQQLQEFGGPEVDKPDILQGSSGNTRTPLRGGSSPSLAKQLIFDPRVRYNGDLVQMKPIQTGANVEIKAKTVELLVLLHGLRHENLNPLIGCLAEPPRACLVSEWCARGSLQDVLQQDDIKLDWSFRLSLLTDLVRGMKYLHSTPIRVHGFLTSRNCVIDARWVLKVTDYGLPAFYEAQGINLEQKIAKDLLWSAPELLRHVNLLKKGSQPGDVYSFGIIMQEVVVRGEPFCMLALTPEEIIEKVKHPPPLIRPSVSKGAAPPEAINIMRQCWAEQAEMRPDFNAVHDQFKKLNHGKKANIVDTMFQMLEKYSNNLEELIRERTEQLDMEKKKTEQLLNRMLPSSVAEKLKLGMPVDPEEFAEVTIYFSDIVGFTTISAHSTPFQVVDLLNDLYTCFDATINAYNVYKVETIGDAYMVVGGLPVRVPDHAEQIATMALDLLHQSGRFRIRHLPCTPLRLRIGLHTGPCCAGVVGLTMPRYCLFGDTVNTASRMESTGSAWRIHLSEATKERLEQAGGYQLEYRGPTEIKGKGTMQTYWLLGKSGFTKTLPDPPSIELDESLIISKSLANNYANDDSDSVNGSMDRIGMAISVDEHSTESTRALHHDPTFIKTMECSKFASLIRSQDQCDHLHHIVKSTSSETPGVSLGTPVSASEVAAALLGASTSSLCGFRGRPRRIEEEDLSTPYNHYKCLSPKDRIGKSLRRQFSLDRTEEVVNEMAQCLSPRLCKQNSAGAADLEKIEETPSTSKTPTTTPVTTLQCSLSISVDSLLHSK